MERLTKTKLVNGNLVCYPQNNSGLPEYVIKQNPYRKIVEKLKEYEDLEEQQKLLRLPCAVGDTVYQHMIVGVDKYKPIYEIVKAKVFKFSFTSGGLCFWTQTADEKKYQNTISLSAFGKTVFLTREEAETALTNMNINASKLKKIDN